MLKYNGVGLGPKPPLVAGKPFLPELRNFLPAVGFDDWRIS
jgi:hypothetical protein